jgi:hypothetical protein
MAEREDQIRDLAVAIIEENGADAHRWTKLRAELFRNEGDHQRAAFWEDVAELVSKIQGGLDRRRYH